MPGFKDDALLTLLGVGATGVCEFEGRRAPELEKDVDFVAFVDIHARLLATADLDAGKRMDGLGDVDGGATFAGLVGNAGDGELTGLLGNTAEVGRLGLGVPTAVEVVGDVERRSAGQGVGDAFADTVILAGLEGVDRRSLVEMDLDSLAVGFVLLLAASCIADGADADMLAAEAEVLSRNPHAVGVSVDIGNTISLGSGSGLVLDFDFDVKGGNAGKRDGNSIFMLLLLRTVFEGLTRLGKGSRWLSVDALLDKEGLVDLAVEIQRV